MRFTFGVAADLTMGASAWLDLVGRAEAAGYDCLLVTDHLGAALTPWPALGSAAAVTKRLRLGTYVLNTCLHHPGVAVSDALALDGLAGGGSILGLGAGWLPDDHRLAGMERMPGGDARFDGLRATVELFRSRQPLGWPGPELLLGGARRRVLALAGEHADIVSVVPRLGAPLGAGGPMDYHDMLPETVDRQVGWIHSGARDRSRSPVLNHLLWGIAVTDNPEPVVAEIARQWDCPEKRVGALIPYLIGTVDEIAAELIARRRRWGFSFVTVPAVVLDAFVPVMHALRDSSPD